MPYICSMTLGGSHRTRTGFWEFYDHWYDYEGFGLPERPELDPEDWMQRNPDGSMKSTYGIKPDQDDFYPPYEPNMRYATCVNNPGWRAWLDTVAQQVARVGYDGAFIDNGCTQECYCEFCQAKYQDFLRAKYSAAEMSELFGVKGDERVPLTPKPERGGATTVGWAETQRFFIESIHQHELAIRKAAEEVGEQFLLFPNAGRPRYIKSALHECDYAMFELSHGDYGSNPGLVKSRIVEDIHLRVHNDHAFEYKYVQAVRARVRALCLTRGGYPKSLPALALNEDTARLAMAESAAFGSGAGFLVRPDWGRFGEPMAEYRGFFEEHAAQYAGLVPYAQVGMAVFADQAIYGHSAHLATTKALTQAMLQGHVLFDYVLEHRFTADNLREFDLVVLPDVRFATVEQMEALAEYVAGGGVAIVMGQPPTHDLQMRPLAKGVVPAKLAALAATGQPGAASDGQGRWAFLTTAPDMAVIEALEQAAGRPLAIMEAEVSGAARANAFIRPEGDAEIIVHLLNYDTPLGALPDTIDVKEDLTITLPLPEGAQATGVTAWSPDREGAMDIPVRMDGGAAVFTVPSLRIYEMIRVELG